MLSFGGSCSFIHWGGVKPRGPWSLSNPPQLPVFPILQAAAAMICLHGEQKCATQRQGGPSGSREGFALTHTVVQGNCPGETWAFVLVEGIGLCLHQGARLLCVD